MGKKLPPWVLQLGLSKDFRGVSQDGVSAPRPSSRAMGNSEARQTRPSLSHRGWWRLASAVARVTNGLRWPLSPKVTVWFRELRHRQSASSEPWASREISAGLT